MCEYGALLPPATLLLTIKWPVVGSAVMASFWKVLAWTSSSSFLRSFSPASSSSSSSRLWDKKRRMTKGKALDQLQLDQEVREKPDYDKKKKWENKFICIETAWIRFSIFATCKLWFTTWNNSPGGQRQICQQSFVKWDAATQVYSKTCVYMQQSVLHWPGHIF